MSATLCKAVFFGLASLLLTSVAGGQNNRSAVSVNGSDAATCTVPNPCRTFAVALSRTNPNGEVVALTSGGFTPFTINKPATIVAAPGVYAALVAPSGDAIHVNAGSGAKVVIRGLHLYGMEAFNNNNGISVTGSSSEVHVEHCVIDGFTMGIVASLNVHVSDSTIRRCGWGIMISNDGQPVKGTINRVEVRQSTIGIMSSSNANVTVRDSVASRCSFHGFLAGQGGQLNIENSLATNNGVGVQANAASIVRVSNTMATGNDTGFLNVDQVSTFISWGNNKVQGNSTDKSGTITVVAQD